MTRGIGMRQCMLKTGWEQQAGRGGLTMGHMDAWGG